VLDAAGSHDNSKIASCSSDKSVLLWDVSTGNTLQRYRGHNSKVNCVKFNADGTLLITSSYDATVKVWDIRSRAHDPIMTLNEVRCAVFDWCLHLRMPLVTTPARLKLLHACDQ
jgi:mitogen-activated protein kinase organizer 1